MMFLLGQFETYLFQKGESSILEAIKKCWASSFSMRVMQHRLDCGLSTSNIAMAVVIQVSLETVAKLYIMCSLVITCISVASDWWTVFFMLFT